MKGIGRIVGYAVNRKAISVRIELSGAMTAIDELEQYKDRMKTVRLDSFQVIGKIESITIGKRVGLLMHVARLDFINHRLFVLTEKNSIVMEVSTTRQDKLLYFLETVAKRRKAKTVDLLFELSSFRKKEGDGERTIPGKRSVFDLSESQMNVVFDKLSHLAATGP